MTRGYCRVRLANNSTMAPVLMRKSWVTPRNDALLAGTAKGYFEPHAPTDAPSGS